MVDLLNTQVDIMQNLKFLKIISDEMESSQWRNWLDSAIPTSDVTPYVIKSSIDATEEHICVIISSCSTLPMTSPNANHEFSPICVALATAENSRSAAEMLEWTRDHSDGAIVAVLADGSRALSKAINDVFDTAHMLRWHKFLLFSPLNSNVF